MRAAAIGLALLVSALPGAAAMAAGPGGEAPIIQLHDGHIRGLVGADGIAAFKGIPYAAAPVGALRWRSPRPPHPWTGIRDAGDFGPRCPSPEGGPFADPTPGREDCLTANVWTQVGFGRARRPVMVWIHGGGFQFGSSHELSNDGARLAAKGVVVVSFNYRLGVLGFLAHPALDAEGSRSGNYGLQDQLRALRWVRANAASFGGDPRNVTVFGESAGAMSVGLLMSSPLARGLFDKAIGESGAFWDSEHGSLQTRAEAEARGRALAARMGKGTIAGLRAVPADQLIAATAVGPTADPVIDAFSPDVDGYVLTTSPAQAFARGTQVRVPLLAGHNGAEDFIFRAHALPHASAAEFREAASVVFGPANLQRFLAAYPAETDAVAGQSANALIGDMAIAQQSWAWLQMHARTGRSPVYGYEFYYHSAYSPLPVHGAEMDFVFGTLRPQRLANPAVAPGQRDRELADQMVGYWTNFARNGNPNGPGLPVWPRYDPAAPRVMGFGDTSAAKPESDNARFTFIESFRSEGRFPDRWRHLPTTAPASPGGSGQ